MTQRLEGVALSRYIDGQKYDVVARTMQQAEKSFARTARRSWLRRKIRCFVDEPANMSLRMADTYHDGSLAGFPLLKALVDRARGYCNCSLVRS
jgi:hypothetical protein